MRALVVDDSKTTRMILRGVLSHLGFEVYEASDGREALARLSELANLDLAMVDWNMPVMSGLDFVVAVRSDSRFDNLVLIMVTTNNDLESVTRALAAGANEYIMKPFNREMVREKLELLGVMVSQ